CSQEVRCKDKNAISQTASQSACQQRRGTGRRRSNQGENDGAPPDPGAMRLVALMPVSIADPLTLPCGVRLKNRLAKAAMTEGLADPWNRSTPRLETLYRRWAEGGAGLLLTGNVQVDRRYLERPGNVAIDGPQNADA